MLFPSANCAERCAEFLLKQSPEVVQASIKVLKFMARLQKDSSTASTAVLPPLVAVIYPRDIWPIAKQFWQHTGEGISSRRAEYCQRAFDDGFLVLSNSPPTTPRVAKGPKRYQRLSVDNTSLNGKSSNCVNEEHATKNHDLPDSAQFVEERFGRNLDVTLAGQAKLAIRKRIAGSLTSDADLPDSLTAPIDEKRVRNRDVPGFSTEDVYIYPGGMNAIFHAHQVLKSSVREAKSAMYGFPYVDTLKVLEKFGPGAIFYGHGNSDELDDLESRLKAGERILSLFCEFPGNPLLKTPDMQRIRRLAEEYDFAVVVDETIGNFLNVHVLPYADILVSSLTKIFSGDSNVMGGSMVLNPSSKYYRQLKQYLEANYEDNQFEEDSIYLERNSRDFVSRIQRINHNAEAIADVLRAHPKVKQVMYPKYSDTKAFYDVCKLPEGGYGGLLSATFYSIGDAEAFYDNLDTHKGPSLGTNFTLSSPFVLLAHYAELDWAAEYGCEASLVRFTVGLEDTEKLKTVFETALAAIPR
jgi:cystathionine gamma-synthase